jgi:hypothetical protein
VGWIQRDQRSDSCGWGTKHAEMKSEFSQKAANHLRNRGSFDRKSPLCGFKKLPLLQSGNITCVYMEWGAGIAQLI